MRKDKNPDLAEHFEKLKSILPEIYHPKKKVSKTTSDRLLALLQSSLSVIEAVYLQNPDSFTSTRLDVYGHIVSELKDMGVDYHGNEEILSKAAGSMIMKTKKPMERAGQRGMSSDGESSKEAV